MVRKSMRMFLKSKSAITRLETALLILVIIAAAVAGYFGYLATIPPPPPPPPPVMEVKIGIVYPLSGALAASGKMIRDVVDFAIREINDAGGIKSLGGTRIAAIWADSKGKPETGADEVERLITEENVVALFGCYQSSVTYSSSEVSERYSVPFLNPESSSPKLTGGPGTGYDPRGAKWFFRTGPHDVQFAMVMFKFLEDVQKETGITVSTIATVCEDTLYGKTAADTVKRLNTELGYNYELVAEILYPHEAASVDAEVMTLKAANPDVVWMASYLHDAILFQTTYKALDFNPKLLLVFDAGHTHPDFYKIPESGYVASRLAWNWDVKKENSMAVDKKFYDIFGYHMTGYQAREYTGMYALYWALEEAGKVASPEDPVEFRTAIRDALLAFDVPGEDIIMPWAGIKFDENGQNIHATGIQGQLFWTTPEGAPLESAEYYTVWPFEVASRKYVFPQPTWAEG